MVVALGPRGMWDLPGPRINPMSPALAGKFFTTEPPGKSPFYLIFTTILWSGNFSHLFREKTEGQRGKITYISNTVRIYILGLFIYPLHIPLCDSVLVKTWLQAMLYTTWHLSPQLLKLPFTHLHLPLLLGDWTRGRFWPKVSQFMG